MAEKHVAEARRAAERQRKIVATLQRRRINANDAQTRLAQLERAQATYENELEAIMRERGN